jgi:hypothetical protein
VADQETKKRPSFVQEYAELLGQIGPTAFKVRFRGSVLIGLGMVGKATRPTKWGRRTLGALDLDKLEKIKSVKDRVWRIRKSPSAQRGPYITLGQSADNDIVIPEYTVSTKHCAFVFEGMRMNVIDLNSLNGVVMNDKLVEPNTPHALRDKVRLTVGRLQFGYLAADSFFSHIQRTIEKKRKKRQK